MEKNETAKNYLLDLGREIILLANKSNSSVDKNGIDYELGRSYAYYEILSLMKNQAAAFGLNNNDIGIGDFSIESLLKG